MGSLVDALACGTSPTSTLACMSLVRVWVLLLTCAVLTAACGSETIKPAKPTRADLAAAARAPSGDWTQFDYDAQRTGVGPGATGINAGNLRLLRERVVHLDGTVDSAPIELHAIDVGGTRRDVIVVTTTYGHTVAIEAQTGRTLWEFTPSDIGRYAGSYQVTTATPIADPDDRYVYAAAPDGLIHKLVLATGADVHNGHWPARVTYDATHEKIASPLNISGRWLVVVTGGYLGDAPPYQGHVVLIDRSSGAVAHVFNTLCSNRHYLIDPSTCSASDSAIWARAGAVIEPGSGRILVATGNAPFNGSTNWGDSVLELSPDATRVLHNWTPRNQAQLDANDTDLGSTAPALLGDGLAVQGGKAGVLSLLDLSRLVGPGPRTGGELQDTATPGSDQMLTAPAVWRHQGRTYVIGADGSGTTGYVLVPGARPRLRVAWSNGTAGTSPVIAGGLLYVFDPGGALNVYWPGTGGRLGSLPAASGHWNSPIVVGGRIVLPVGNYQAHSDHGTLLIYHLPGR